MADSLEDDFALSDVESVGGQSGQSEDGEGERIAQKSASKRKEVHQQQDGSEELTEEEKRARKKRKMKEQDKKRKAKVSLGR